MGRILLCAMLVYGYGDPGFDGHRPASLDRPLRNFHRAVDTTAIGAQRALVALDSDGKLIETLPKLGSKLRSLGDVLAPG